MTLDTVALVRYTNSMSARNFFVCSIFIACALSVLGCAKSPVTGRTQVNIISRSEELAMGKQAASQTLRTTRTYRDSARAAAVRRVGRNIARQVDVPDAAWSFNCVESPGFNAFCLPGGHVFVNSGVFRYVENDDQLAGVIGHEVGHALARHGAEKVSRARLTAAAVAVLAIGAGTVANDPSVMGDMASGLGAAATLAFILPGSREQEYEADKLGLMLMIKAGYDPEQFPLLWSRLIDSGVMKNTRDLAATHPADAKRLAAMRDYLPEARRLAGPPPEGGTALASADTPPQAPPADRQAPTPAPETANALAPAAPSPDGEHARASAPLTAQPGAQPGAQSAQKAADSSLGQAVEQAPEQTGVPLQDEADARNAKQPKKKRTRPPASGS